MTVSDHIDRIASEIDSALHSLSQLRNLGSDKPRSALEHAQAVARAGDWIKHHSAIVLAHYQVEAKRQRTADSEQQSAKGGQ